LNESESTRLFEIIRDLRARELAIIYVSHRLEEVFAIADRISVLRDGRCVESLERPNASIAGVIEQMIGRKPSDSAPKEADRGTAGPALSVRNLETRSGIGPLSFDVGRGEILGFAGLEGAGITQLFQALFGLESVRRGLISIGEKELAVRSPRTAISSGVAMIPASRRDEGLMMPWSIRRNSTLLILRQLTRLGSIDPRKTRKHAEETVRAFRIATESVDKPVQWLSGGNQQKTLIAKWLAVKPRILILNDPTRGVDIGAKEEIHSIIRDLAAQGMTILLTSSEIEETLALSRRTLVLHKGSVFAEFQAKADKADVLHAMSGIIMDAPSEAQPR
jgi:ABC-type sugar transport system ATPase subunit